MGRVCMGRVCYGPCLLWASYLTLGQKKIYNCFSGHFWKKQMRQAGFFFFFFFHQKTDEATFFFFGIWKTYVKKLLFFLFCSKNRLWVCTRAASPIICLKSKIRKQMYVYHCRTYIALPVGCIFYYDVPVEIPDSHLA